MGGVVLKKLLALLWILALCAGLLVYSFLDRPSLPEEPVETGEPVELTRSEPEPPPLYFLNGQPVLQLIWDQLSEEFALQTGIRVQVVPSQTHLQGQDPVMFSISGSEELGQWACMDLTQAVAYANLASEKFTLTDGETVCGIASEAEPFGLIYNTELLARVGYTEADIDSFSDLKTVVGLITANREKLGFGAFSQPDAAGAFAALLAAVPGEVRPFWDLYSSNMAEGTLGEGTAVFQLGTLTDMERLIAGGGLQLGILPLYTGGEKESEQGLYCFGKHYWCIREDASPEQKNQALAFLNFLVSPRTDGTVPVDDLGILAPYRQAVYANDPVEQRFRRDIAQGKEVPVCGAEPTASEELVEALMHYAQEPTDENWAVVNNIK